MNLTNALAICELEPFLSLMERPAPTLPTEYPRDRIAFIGKYWRACQKARFTVVNEHTFPERKTHPNLLDSFIQLTDMPTNRPPAPATGSGSTRSNLRTSRLMNEIRATASNGAHPKYDVYVSESDMSFWKVRILEPSCTYGEFATLLTHPVGGHERPRRLSLLPRHLPALPSR